MHIWVLSGKLPTRNSPRGKEFLFLFGSWRWGVVRYVPVLAPVSTTGLWHAVFPAGVRGREGLRGAVCRSEVHG